MKINVSNTMFDPVSFLLVNTPTHVGKSCERFWAIQYSTTMACIHQKNCQSWFRNSVSLFPIFPAKIARTKVLFLPQNLPKSGLSRLFFLGKLTQKTPGWTLRTLRQVGQKPHQETGRHHPPRGAKPGPRRANETTRNVCDLPFLYEHRCNMIYVTYL